MIIVPDKRYCFDHFISESTIADIIYQHENKNKNHSIKSVIEHRALTCHNNSIRHWNGDHGNIIVDSLAIENAINEYNSNIKNNVYIDVHSLQFTPDSFRTNIELLNKIKYTKLEIEEIYPTILNSGEFFVILKKPLTHICM